MLVLKLLLEEYSFSKLKKLFISYEFKFSNSTKIIVVKIKFNIVIFFKGKTMPNKFLNLKINFRSTLFLISSFKLYPDVVMSLIFLEKEFVKYSLSK